MLLAATVFGAVLAHAKPAGPQFVKFSTEHFDVELDQSMAEYRPYVEVYLELGYRMFQKYTGVDYNTMMNKVNVAYVHKPRYLYQLPTSDYMWNKGWGGGLTICNKSQMNANLVKTLDEKSMRIDQSGLTILWHELANGVLLTIICRSVGENLLPFFAEYKVKVDDETAKQLSKLPQAKITVAREIWVPEVFRQ